MKSKPPKILLINPWIYDFAAYDFWAKPLGLLTIASLLRFHEHEIYYIDCLDRFHPKARKTDPYKRWGRGPYLKTPVKKPKGLENIPRTYSRYGIKPQWLKSDLSKLPEPDLILVTSLMTYWYPGIKETIKVIREFFPYVPIILGGVYATLCEEHAKKKLGADHIITGHAVSAIFDLIEDYTGFKTDLRCDLDNINHRPYPAFDMQHKTGYVPILTGTGCPFACAYCASSFLNPVHMRRSPENVFNEIVHWRKNLNIKDFAFYDDALLLKAKSHIIPLLEMLIKENINVRFHTPNALHISKIDDLLASTMKKAGFVTIRLGLETAVFEERFSMDKKVTEEEFVKCVQSLLNAGFKREEVGAYLLAGLPGQSLKSLELSIKLVKKTGITPIPAYYTPIPHTLLWDKAVKSSVYDLEADPVFTNNAVFPCWPQGFSWKTMTHIKNLIHG